MNFTEWFNHKNPLKECSFCWKGIDKNGKKISGEICSVNKQAAYIALSNKHIAVSNIRRTFYFPFRRNNKINARAINLFFRQLASLVQAGVPLIQAFDIILSGCETPALSTLLTKIKTSIKQGNALSEAFKTHIHSLDHFALQFIQAGEQSGQLATMLDHIATYREQIETTKKKIKKAVIYPIVLLIVACAVTALLMVFVVPQFETLFSNFGADLPILTQLVIRMSSMARAYGLFVAFGFAFLIKLFSVMRKRSKRVNAWVTQCIFKLPIYGQALRKSFIANFARTLAVTLKSGVPLLDTLKIQSENTSNPLFQTALIKTYSAIKTGQTFHDSLEASCFFPALMLQMTKLGEETGQLKDMLEKVAEYYDNDVSHIINLLNQLLEPLLMLLLGLVIGGLVIALYLPIFKLGAVV
ncbi:MAG: type II secretion system F family protein [Pseudomonadota bacterium]|nr:type II secretion system F family protein [Gammaproteobacteria bacterium]